MSSVPYIQVRPTIPQGSAQIPHVPQSLLFFPYSSLSSPTFLGKGNFRLDAWTPGITKTPYQKQNGGVSEQGLVYSAPEACCQGALSFCHSPRSRQSQHKCLGCSQNQWPRKSRKSNIQQMWCLPTCLSQLHKATTQLPIKHSLAPGKNK